MEGTLEDLGGTRVSCRHSPPLYSALLGLREAGCAHTRLHVASGCLLPRGGQTRKSQLQVTHRERWRPAQAHRCRSRVVRQTLPTPYLRAHPHTNSQNINMCDHPSQADGYAFQNPRGTPLLKIGEATSKSGLHVLLYFDAWCDVTLTRSTGNPRALTSRTAQVGMTCCRLAWILEHFGG